jgi:hypothetical protein
MAIELRKIVKRKTVETCSSTRRHLIVALEPGDVIAFKEYGRRKWYKAPLSKVFLQVVRWNVESEDAMKRAEKQLNKELKEV